MADGQYDTSYGRANAWTKDYDYRNRCSYPKNSQRHTTPDALSESTKATGTQLNLTHTKQASRSSASSEPLSRFYVVKAKSELAILDSVSQDNWIGTKEDFKILKDSLSTRGLGTHKVYLFVTVTDKNRFYGLALLKSVNYEAVRIIEWLCIKDLPILVAEKRIPSIRQALSKTAKVFELENIPGRQLYEFFEEYELNESSILPSISTGSSSRDYGLQAQKYDDHVKSTDWLKDTSRQLTVGNSDAHLDTTVNHGLRNLGNTCYMNCIMQCIAKTKLIREAELNTTDTVARRFVELMNAMNSGDSRQPVDPSRFREQLSNFSQRFAGYQQQDAHEFLMYFIDRFKHEFRSASGGPALFDDVFYGEIEHQFTYKRCGHRSQRRQVFSILSLPTCTDARSHCDDNIRELFNNFFKEDQLDGDAICSHCEKPQACVAKNVIKRFPKVLIIYLKRNSSKSGDSRLARAVTFPSKGLDVTDSAARGRAYIYNLYAVCYHFGTTVGGHFTADVKNSDSDKWFNYSDSQVRAASVPGSATRDAYMLFYERQDVR